MFRRYRSQLVERVIELINPVLREWVNYFAVGQSDRCFRYIVPKVVPAGKAP